MVVFTDTTSVISPEFVAKIPADKLAVTLIRISQDTGVQFNQARSFSLTISVIGDWKSVVKAHICLERLLIEDGSTEQDISYQIDHLNEIKKEIDDTGSTCSNLVQGNGAGSFDDESFKKHKDAHNKSKENHFMNEQVEDNYINNPCNDDHTNVTIKEEYGMDHDTDIDTEYVAKSDEEQLLSPYIDRLDTNVKVKVEKSSDEKTRGSECSDSEPHTKLKRKAMKVEENQEQMNSLTEFKRGRTKLSEKKTEDGKKKRKKYVKRKRDISVSEADKEFKCSMCKYVGQKIKNLREHMKRMHRNTFSCEQCSKQFGYQKDLSFHMRNVHSNPGCYCEVCGRYCKWSISLKNHMLTHEENYVKPRLECEDCNKIFTTKHGLLSHMKIEHQGFRNSFKCPVCGRCFPRKSSFMQHANIHAGIKPYICDVCGKAYSYHKSLKDHKYVHEEEKRYTCDICAKAFKQQASLLTHLKVHQDREFICTTCGKGFTQMQALVRHERVHSGEKPFECALCSRSFSDYSIIRRHMIMYHKRERDPNVWRDDIICSLKIRKVVRIKGYKVEDIPNTVSWLQPDDNVKSINKSAVDTPIDPETEIDNVVLNNHTADSVSKMTNSPSSHQSTDKVATVDQDFGLDMIMQDKPVSVDGLTRDM